MLAQLDPSAIVSRWFHLAAVIVAIGGTVFMRFVLHTPLNTTLPDEISRPLRERVLRIWTRVLHTCILILILSGTYNAILQFPRHKPAEGQMALYHVVFGVKLVLVLLLFFIAIAVTGRSRTFEAMRQKRARWLAISAALAGVIVLLSNLLKSIPPSS